MSYPITYITSHTLAGGKVIQAHYTATDQKYLGPCTKYGVKPLGVRAGARTFTRILPYKTVSGRVFMAHYIGDKYLDTCGKLGNMPLSQITGVAAPNVDDSDEKSVGEETGEDESVGEETDGETGEDESVGEETDGETAEVPTIVPPVSTPTVKSALVADPQLRSLQLQLYAVFILLLIVVVTTVPNILPTITPYFNIGVKYCQHVIQYIQRVAQCASK